MEGFFYPCLFYTYEELIEFLLRRYHSLDVFQQLSVEEFGRFLKIARDQEIKERNYLAWCTQLPMMTQDNYISFPDYNAKMTGENLDMRPAEEIMSEVEEIRRQINGNKSI